MSSIVPSPFSRLATATQTGLLSLTAQDLKGVKTLLDGAVIGAPITGGNGTLTLDNTTGAELRFASAASFLATSQMARAYGANVTLWASSGAGSVTGQGAAGAVSGDTPVKLGTTQSDASTNAAAKLTAWFTGLGTGTEVEKAHIRKSGAGVFNGVGVGTAQDLYSVVHGVKYDTVSGFLSLSNGNGGAQLGISMASGAASCTGSFTSTQFLWNTTGGLLSAGGISRLIAASGEAWKIASNLSGAGSEVVTVGTSVADGSVNDASKLFRVATGITGTEVEKLSFTKAATLSVLGSMKTGIGAATLTAFGPSGDDNTGLWFPASDTINVVTGGTLRSQWTSGGTFAHQGPISMPTNSLLSIGATMLYERTAGIIDFSGVLQLNSGSVGRPTASSANRGSLWYSKSAAGAADTLQVCLKSAADTYSWVTIATG